MIKEGGTMMKRKYVEPEIKVIVLYEKDIIRTSDTTVSGGEGTGGNDNGEGGIF